MAGSSGLASNQTVQFPNSYLGIGDVQRACFEISQFETQFNDSKHTSFWGEITAGSGSATHTPNYSTVKMDVGTASGDRILRRTHMWFRYQPGIPSLVDQSFVGVAAKENQVFRAGIFDDNDGIYIEQNGTDGIYFVIRSSTSGSVEERKKVHQDDWNLDKLDGTGFSREILDLSKANLFIIEYLWLGVGPVRCGFEINGERVWCHEFHNQDLAFPYMSTGNLPLSIELVNTGTVASASSVYHICSAVKSQGGKNYQEIPGSLFSAGREVVASVTTGAYVPIFSIRPKATYGSKTNRSMIIPQEFHTYASDVAIWKLVYAPTLTGASWTSASSLSVSEYDVTATAINGGIDLLTFYGDKRSVDSAAVIASEIKSALTLLADGTQVPLTIMAKSLTSTLTARSSMAWKELH